MPVLLLYKIRLIPNWKAKEIVLTHFFKNTPIEEFQSKCDDFANNLIPSILRPDAVKQIQWHKKNGDKIIVVTASAENWLRCWCGKWGVALIGTQLEVVDHKITGKLSTKNCYGPEKLKRVLEAMDIKDFEKIYVYGDSRGDKELLSIATNPYFKYFKGSLRT